MIIKNKRLWSIIILSFVFLVFAGHALALEIKYPIIPGIDANPNSGKIEDYVKYIFGLMVYIAGFLAAISFAVGAVQLIISLDSAERNSNAKERMRGAGLGLFLVMASYVILKTVGGDYLVTLQPLNVGPGNGVVYYNGSDTRPCPEAVADTTTKPKDYNQIKYICPNNSGPKLIVVKWPQVNYGTDADASSEILCCGDETSVNPGSFKWFFQTSGVYYYLNAGCKGLISNAITGDQDQIPDPFKGKVKSVGIVGTYGYILHKNVGVNNGGLCTPKKIHTNDSSSSSSSCSKQPDECFEVPNNFAASAATIFNWNKDYANSGDGAVFFSEPYGWNTGAYAGRYEVKKEKTDPYYEGDACNMTFSYTRISRTAEYENKYKTFKDRPGSIQVRGSYVVALYVGKDNSSTTPTGGGPCICQDSNGNCVPMQTCDDGSQSCQCNPSGSDPTSGGNGEPGAFAPQIKLASMSYLLADYTNGGTSSNGSNNCASDIPSEPTYCQTFRTSVPNLNAEPFLPTSGGAVGTIYVIPIKQ